MRKPFALLLLLSLVVGLTVVLSACEPPIMVGSQESTATEQTAITRERAIEIALAEAGVSRDAVYELEAELDRERTGLFWEVDFESGGYEYSYDVSSETGAIARVERERD